jgi:hypothetical protein
LAALVTRSLAARGRWFPASSHASASKILDGKIVPCDRCKEPALSVKGEVIDLWYSGKAHTHGGNVQAALVLTHFEYGHVA